MEGSRSNKWVQNGVHKSREKVSLLRSFPVNPWVSGAPKKGSVSGVINEHLTHYTRAPFMGSKRRSIMIPIMRSIMMHFGVPKRCPINGYIIMSI